MLKQWFTASLQEWHRRSNWYVRHRSANQNVYHCTVQRSASQWMRSLLSDERTYRHSGLRCHDPELMLPGQHDPRPLTGRTFAAPFPPQTIITPAYLDYAGFATIPKPPRYKAFFVMRDPRDVLVSWYFSIKNSHPLLGRIEHIRGDLTSLSHEDGFLYAIDFLSGYGLFAAQRSWAGADAKDANVMLVRHEDLTMPENVPMVEKVLHHCGIHMPRQVLAELLETHRFEKLTGRNRGQEDLNSHYRKGVAGDWRNHFTDRIAARFDETAGDLIGLWKYQ